MSWSAALRKVAFSINSAAGDGQRLFLADFDGRNPKLILSHPHVAVYHGEVSDYGPPFFSADSKTMLLRVSRTTAQGGGLLFTHADWREPVEFMHHCSTKWATVLIGLRSGLEGGAFAAFPDDTKISGSWR